MALADDEERALQEGLVALLRRLAPAPLARSLVAELFTHLTEHEGVDLDRLRAATRDLVVRAVTDGP